MSTQEIMEGTGRGAETIVLSALIKFGAIVVGVILLILLFRIIKAKITGEDIKQSLSGSGQRKINATLKGSDLEISTKPQGFIFGKVNKTKKAFLPSDKEGHIIVFGGSGKGKTSALLIPSLRAWVGTFFAIDISGDINANVHRDDEIILAPDDPDNSVLYNVFLAIDRCRTENEKRKKLELLTNLIVEIPPNVNDTQYYFLNTGRKLLRASLIAFYDLGYDFVDICKTICFNNLKDLFDMIDAANNKQASSIISSLKGANEKNINGAKETLEDKVGLFANDVNMEKLLRRPMEWDDGVQEPCFNLDMLEDHCVFLQVPDREQEYYAAFMRIVTGQVLDYIYTRNFKRGESKRILIALDEFASLGHLELLAPFRKFRKFGANLCVLTQELADMDLTYSEKERKAIIGNCKYITVLNAVEPDTKEYFSKIIGKEQVERVSSTQSSNSSSKSTSLAEEFAVDPGEWNELGDNLIVIHPHGYARLGLNFYYKEDSKKHA